MSKDTIRDYWTGDSLHASYWATQSTPAQHSRERETVQQRQARAILQYRAMRAQYIKPNEITG